MYAVDPGPSISLRKSGSAYTACSSRSSCSILAKPVNQPTVAYGPVIPMTNSVGVPVMSSAFCAISTPTAIPSLRCPGAHTLVTAVT